MDKIIIKDLLAHGIIGVNEREREQPQDILINLILYTDLKAAGQSDRIEDSINYAEIAEQVKRHAQTAKRLTVEALAQDIADMLLNEVGVNQVVVRVEKPNAIEYAGSVGVEIKRSR